MKTGLIVLCVILCLLGGLVWAVLYGPLFPFKMIDTEASRITSPDKKVDAVYIQSDAGAMTSVHHTVYIVPKGQQITKRDKAVFSGNRVWNVKLIWTSSNELCVQHGEGKIYHFQNYCYPFLKNHKYEVRISEEQVEEK